MINAPVSDIFISIQGEGVFVGEKQTFVRFYGCNLTCSFCDTKLYTWQDTGVDELRGRIRSLNGSDPAKYISLTGGEPLLHAGFLKAAIPVMRDDGYKIYLETNGTLYNELDKVIDLMDVVAMDIKLPSSCGLPDMWDDHKKFIARAKDKFVFVKAVITDMTLDADFVSAVDIVSGVNKDIPFIIQPASFAEDIIDVKWDRLKRLKDMAAGSLSDVRMVPQMHKLAGIR